MLPGFLVLSTLIYQFCRAALALPTLEDVEVATAAANASALAGAGAMAGAGAVTSGSKWAHWSLEMPSSLSFLAMLQVRCRRALPPRSIAPPLCAATLRRHVRRYVRRCRASPSPRATAAVCPCRRTFVSRTLTGCARSTRRL